jgi:hypothetical protein
VDIQCDVKSDGHPQPPEGVSEGTPILRAPSPAIRSVVHGELQRYGSRIVHDSALI